MILLAMKQLCVMADVKPEKANPRNLLRLYEQMQEELQKKVALLIQQSYQKILEAEDVLILAEEMGQ